MCLHLSCLAVKSGQGNLDARSEEHTSELQSHLNLVCRLLLEKKKQRNLMHRDALPPKSLGPPVPTPLRTTVVAIWLTPRPQCREPPNGPPALAHERLRYSALV